MCDRGFAEQSENLVLTCRKWEGRSALTEEGHVAAHTATGPVWLPRSMPQRLGDSCGRWESSEGGEGHRSHPCGPCGRKGGG